MTYLLVTFSAPELATSQSVLFYALTRITGEALILAVAESMVLWRARSLHSSQLPRAQADSYACMQASVLVSSSQSWLQ